MYYVFTFLIAMIISRYIEIIHGSRQNEIINLMFLIVAIISRHIEKIIRQNETINFNVPIVEIIS